MSLKMPTTHSSVKNFACVQRMILSIGYVNSYFVQFNDHVVLLKTDFLNVELNIKLITFLYKISFSFGDA